MRGAVWLAAIGVGVSACSGPVRAPWEEALPAKRTLALAAGREEIGHETASASLDPGGATALDRLTLEGVLAFRRERVAAHARLGVFPRPYDPLAGESRRIWASISPGVRWLGPTAYYVANPYALVVMTCANHVTPLALGCPDVQLVYEDGRLLESHRGASARCWLARAATGADPPGRLRVVMVNAYDAGFRAAHVDLRASSNVDPVSEGTAVTSRSFGQSSFFHVGRYSANNISPEDPQGWIQLHDPGAPTRIHVKLWQDAPARPAEPADLTYVVDVAP